MPRIRSVKPAICTNEVLAELPAFTRLLFTWLPMWADREGRLEDRPRRLKAEIFPFDDVDIDAMLDQLQEKRFIVRYEANGGRYIQILTFSKHQRPRGDEPPSVIPVRTSSHARQRRIRHAPVTDPPPGSAWSMENGNGNLELENGENTMSAAPTAQAPPAVQVFDYWREVMNHLDAKFGADRQRKVKLRLEEGFTVAALKEAIDGCRASPFHQGANDRGTKYDDLELICRDARHVEQFQHLARNGVVNVRKETVGERNLRERAERHAQEDALDGNPDRQIEAGDGVRGLIGSGDEGGGHGLARNPGRGS